MFTLRILYVEVRFLETSIGIASRATLLASFWDPEIRDRGMDSNLN